MRGLNSVPQKLGEKMYKIKKAKKGLKGRMWKSKNAALETEEERVLLAQILSEDRC